MVHSGYYAPAILFLVMGIILFGIFVRAFYKQILLDGWVVSPRTVWLSCLCCSSLLFVVYQFDAYGIYGLYSPAGSLFLAWFSSAWMIDAGACGLYMYVVIFYRQHMSGVPKTLTRVWIGSNVGTTFAIGLIALIGSASNNIFWYGITGIFAILQEFMVIVVLNISLHKVMLVLWKLRSPTEDFHGALKKMWICRIITTILGLIAIVNQLIGSEDGILRLNKWDVPITPLPVHEFDMFIIFPDLLMILVHILFLYMMTRPTESSNKNNAVIRIQQSQIADLSHQPSVTKSQSAGEQSQA